MEPHSPETAIQYASQWDGMSRDLYLLGLSEVGAASLLERGRARVDLFEVIAGDGGTLEIADAVRAIFSRQEPSLRIHMKLPGSGLGLDTFPLMRDPPENVCDFDICFWPDHLAAVAPSSTELRQLVVNLFNFAVDMASAGDAVAVILAGEGYDFRPGSGFRIWPR